MSGQSIRKICGDRRGEQLAAHDLASPRKGGGYFQRKGGALAHNGVTIGAWRADVTT